MHVCTNISRFMRPIDVKAFHDEAASQKAYILVRRPNPEARKYIGQPGFAPKPVDCKFKTAEQDFDHKGNGTKLTVAGLVVNPMLEEFDKAFKSKKSHLAAVKLWEEYGDTVSHAPPDASQFMVNSDTRSPFFGCVMPGRISPAAHGNFFHADYNLYAYIPASTPKTVKRFLSELYKEPQYREVSFSDYQHRLNRRMGVPMIQRAPQELTGQHIDDQVFVFMPDSTTVFLLAGQLEIRDFYRDTLAGRRLSNR